MRSLIHFQNSKIVFKIIKINRRFSKSKKNLNKQKL